jgi:acetyl esterase/lipase
VLLVLLLWSGVPRAAWADDNAAAAPQTVAYGTDDPRQAMDVYLPTGFAGKRPGIILVHGGAWAFGDKGDYRPLGSLLAARGYVAFALNYRLLPAARYPAQLDDVQRAVRVIRAHADAYNLDPERLGALGDSAGGYLVTMLGVRDTRDNSDPALSKYSSRVQCVADFYGPADFTVPAEEPHVSRLALSLVRNFLGIRSDDALDGYRDLLKSSSPITYVDKQSAPFLILHGVEDRLVYVEQSQKLWAALKAAGVDATLLLVQGQGHGFLTGNTEQSRKNMADFGGSAVAFFARLLKP